MFLIAIVSTFAIGWQTYLFASAASTLTARLRTLSFKAMLRQDSKTIFSIENNAGFDIVSFAS